MVTKKLTGWLLIACLLTLAAAVASGSPSTSTTASGTLMVSAAASLTDAFTRLAEAYQKKHPGVDVKLNFASSGTLATQIEQGAPVDVFASADVKHVDQLISKRLAVPSSRIVFASNRLVIVTPLSSNVKIRELSDLKSRTIRSIGIGDPAHVPNGIYARQALEKAHVWDAIKGKLVFGSDVRQVRTYAILGEVDAAFVFATDARTSKLRTAYVVPENMHEKILYCAAAIKESKNLRAARDFIAFLTSSDGQKIIGKFGFIAAGK